MDRFLVSYDLLKPGQDYNSLFAALENLGAKRVLLSAWALRGNYSCQSLYDTLAAHMDATDRLLVVRVDDWKGEGLIVGVNTIWKS